MSNILHWTVDPKERFDGVFEYPERSLCILELTKSVEPETSEAKTSVVAEAKKKMSNNLYIIAFTTNSNG